MTGYNNTAERIRGQCLPLEDEKAWFNAATAVIWLERKHDLIAEEFTRKGVSPDVAYIIDIDYRESLDALRSTVRALEDKRLEHIYGPHADGLQTLLMGGIAAGACVDPELFD